MAGGRRPVGFLSRLARYRNARIARSRPPPGREMRPSCHGLQIFGGQPFGNPQRKKLSLRGQFHAYFSVRPGTTKSTKGGARWTHIFILRRSRAERLDLTVRLIKPSGANRSPASPRSIAAYGARRRQRQRDATSACKSATYRTWPSSSKKPRTRTAVSS